MREPGLLGSLGSPGKVCQLNLGNLRNVANPGAGDSPKLLAPGFPRFAQVSLGFPMFSEDFLGVLRFS